MHAFMLLGLAGFTTYHQDGAGGGEYGSPAVHAHAWAVQCWGGVGCRNVRVVASCHENDSHACSGTLHNIRVLLLSCCEAAASGMSVPHYGGVHLLCLCLSCAQAPCQVHQS